MSLNWSIHISTTFTWRILVFNDKKPCKLKDKYKFPKAATFYTSRLLQLTHRHIHPEDWGASLHQNTYKITYLITPWSRVLLEKLTGSAASQEIPRIFGTRRFITVFTSARHLSLPCANSIQSPHLTKLHSAKISDMAYDVQIPACLILLLPKISFLDIY
jgi:hypothetical protein